MATEPVDVDADLLGQVRDSVGDAGVTRFVDDAVRNELQRHELGAALNRLHADLGPLPDELVAEAEAFWRAG